MKIRFLFPLMALALTTALRADRVLTLNFLSYDGAGNVTQLVVEDNGAYDTDLAYGAIGSNGILLPGIVGSFSGVGSFENGLPKLLLTGSYTNEAPVGGLNVFLSYGGFGPIHPAGDLFRDRVNIASTGSLNFTYSSFADCGPYFDFATIGTPLANMRWDGGNGFSGVEDRRYGTDGAMSFGQLVVVAADPGSLVTFAVDSAVHIPDEGSVLLLFLVGLGLMVAVRHRVIRTA